MTTTYSSPATLWIDGRLVDPHAKAKTPFEGRIELVRGPNRAERRKVRKRQRAARRKNR